MQHQFQTETKLSKTETKCHWRKCCL